MVTKVFATDVGARLNEEENVSPSVIGVRIADGLIVLRTLWLGPMVESVSSPGDTELAAKVRRECN